MSILTYNELRGLVDSGAIVGVPDENVNGASIDLTLGDLFWMESYERDDVDLSQKEAPEMERHRGAVRLEPGEFCLAQTKEVFNLPADVAAHFMLKSSQARAGLQHLFAGFADPTWNGSVLTLEFHNVLRHHALILRPGMKAGQMVFFRGTSPVPPERSYAARGQYNNNREAQPSKGIR